MIIPALSFGSAAHLYDSVRPTYPADAVAWALGGAGWSEAPGVIDDNSPSKRQLRVLDLGAGTGLLTGVLLAAGHGVFLHRLGQNTAALALNLSRSALRSTKRITSATCARKVSSSRM